MFLNTVFIYILSYTFGSFVQEQIQGESQNLNGTSLIHFKFPSEKKNTAHWRVQTNVS